MGNGSAAAEEWFGAQSYAVARHQTRLMRAHSQDERQKKFSAAA
jgi:hypothetical protein